MRGDRARLSPRMPAAITAAASSRKSASSVRAAIARAKSAEIRSLSRQLHNATKGSGASWINPLAMAWHLSKLSYARGQVGDTLEAKLLPSSFDPYGR